MHVSLPPQLEELVRHKVESGLYNCASEVIVEALWLLDARDHLREIKLEELRKEIQKGLDSGPAGPIDFAAIKARGRKRLAEQQTDKDWSRRKPWLA
jgi:antitoxin ParD1/3/4